MLKLIVQGDVQTPLLASRMAWRSEPVPLSALVRTMTVVAVTAAEAGWFVLSVAFVSDSFAVAEALVMAVPPAFAVAVNVTVADAVDARAPRVQVIVVVPLQVPCDGVGAVVTIRFDGMLCVNDTPVAPPVPLFFTVVVKVRV